MISSVKWFTEGIRNGKLHFLCNAHDINTARKLLKVYLVVKYEKCFSWQFIDLFVL